MKMQTLRKTIIAAVIIFPLAFVGGVIFQKRYVRSFAQYVSPCTVTEYRALYKTLRGNDTVNVRGFLYGGEVLYLADKELNGCGDSIVGVEIPEDGKIAFASQDLVSELRRLSGKESVARAEVEVIGTLAEESRIVSPHVTSSRFNKYSPWARWRSLTRQTWRKS